MENGTRKIGLRVVTGVAIAIIIIVAVFASGIQLPGIEVETGQLNILLKDAPVDVDELWINMTGLEVHKVGDEEGEWIPIDISDAIEKSAPGEELDYLQFDLLLYQDKEVLILAEADVYAGTYNKIRMTVMGAEAWYYVDEFGNPLEINPDTGKPTNPELMTIDPLRVPPNRIDVITNFEIGSEDEVTVIIDMQPDWVAISKSGNLRPVLKATIEQVDTTAPTYESISHSVTTAEATCNFDITIDDNVVLESGGEYQFATNNTGSWVWDSPVSFSSTPQTVSVSKTLSSTSGMVVGYRWNMTDNEGNPNNTPIYTLTITED